jgi:hypothetical protein
LTILECEQISTRSHYNPVPDCTLWTINWSSRDLAYVTFIQYEGGVKLHHLLNVTLLNHNHIKPSTVIEPSTTQSIQATSSSELNHADPVYEDDFVW